MQQEDGFRISIQQQDYWKSSEGGKGNVQLSVLVNAQLRKEDLQAQVSELVGQHEILSTKFHQISGLKLPVQVVDDQPKFVFEFFDFSDTEHGNLTTKQTSLVDQHYEKLFPLEAVQQLQVIYILLPGGLSRLVLTISALCCDYYGLYLLTMQILGRSDKEITNDNDPLQYIDISEWQYEMLEEKDAASAMDYWQKQKAIEIEELRLPVESLNTSNTVGGVNRNIKLSIASEKLERINDALSPIGIELQDYCQCCWQVLLARISTQNPFLIGFGMNGRRQDELKDAIGALSLDVPLVCDDDHSVTFDDYLKKYCDLRQEAEELGIYFSWDSFHKKELSLPERSGFKTCFRYLDFSSLAHCSISGMVENIRGGTCGHALDLLLCRNNGVDIDLRFRQDFFNERDLNILLQQLVHLLENAYQNLATPIDEIIISDESEKNELLGIKSNRVPVPESINCIHTLIESNAEKFPDDISVNFSGQRLTYVQLNKRATQLANYLVSSGIKPGALIGICLDRSLDLPVAILAVLKAGAAYVPIDPEYPLERKSYMLADSKACKLISKSNYESIPGFDKSQVVCLDELVEPIAACAGENPDLDISSSDLAYVIYTSGSTGKPKGVAISHSGLINSTLARINHYPEHSHANFLLLSSYAFDSSVAGLFGSLCSGGSLTILPEGDEKDPQLICRAIESYKITTLLCLPTLYGMMLNQALPGQLNSLQCVIVAGEECPRQLVKAHFESNLTARLYNEYGPTEGTVWSAVYECTEYDALRPVPIGTPVSGVQILVLDHKLNLAPRGSIGELFLGGSNLALGYINNSELTRQRFTLLPQFGDQRVYRTGDLVRLGRNNELYFHGRVDNQVKVRGYRIELEEIEAVIDSISGVENSVVTVLRNESTGDQIVAYVVSSNEELLGLVEQRLKQQLPAFMLPSHIVRLESLPLTSNGKIDRNALPAPESTGKRKASTPPQTNEHMFMADVWSSVLQVENVGIDEAFFDLGGHSIMATQLVARLKDILGVNLSVRALFESPTIESYVNSISQDNHVKKILTEASDLFVTLSDMSEEELELLGRQEQQVEKFSH